MLSYNTRVTYLGCLNPTYEFTPEEKQAMAEHKSKKPIIKADEHYNQKNVRKIHPIKNVILLICSYLGTGKTSAFINYVRENNSKRVLILSPRQLYARSITAEYNCTKEQVNLFNVISM
jgi:hypothetical protein